MKVCLVRPLRPDGRDERTSLRQDRSYVVLAIECDMLRLVNQFGEPTLHDTEAFDIVDSTEPEFWIHKTVDGCRYSGPAGWNRPGFFEEWHDGVRDARDTFREDIMRYYPQVIGDLMHHQLRVMDTHD